MLEGSSRRFGWVTISHRGNGSVKRHALGSTGATLSTFFLVLFLHHGPSITAKTDTPDMVAVTDGGYPIGSDAATAVARPAHTVRLAPFQIDRYKVTARRDVQAGNLHPAMLTGRMPL